MRKAFSFILVLILLFGMMVPAGAAGTPTLTISSGEVKAGETVTLTVSLQNNPGIAATLVYIYFDVNTFEVDLKKDVKLAGSFDYGSISTKSIDDMRGGTTYDGAAGKSGVAVLWYDMTGEDVTQNGAFLTIKLKAKEDAANGDHQVSVSASKNNTCNFDLETVTFSSGDNVLKVTGGDNTKKPENSTVEKVDFTDITDHWAEDYINQAAEAGLVEGYLGLYRPNDTMTRAEFVTILWRAMGEPKPNGKASFTDLTQDWYKDAVAWAEQNKVVNGMGEGKFEPNGQVTREQLVTILHRMAGTPSGMELMFTSLYDKQYQDSSQIGSWAKNAMYWSIYNKVFCGTNAVELGSRLYPKQPANRAQIAVMMTRYLNNVN